MSTRKVMPAENGRRVHTIMWTDGVNVEDEARKQLENVAKMPFVWPHVAVMPDVHWGMGATVGSVIPTVRAIIPAAVGVDIGCGMIAACTTLKASDLPDNLSEMRSAIERAVPHGRTNNGGLGDRGAWEDAPGVVLEAWKTLADEFRTMLEQHPKLKTRIWPYNHLGTLGTGNHFVEVCLDEQQRVWIMLHSGSRGIGNKIGTYFIEIAKEEMRKWHIFDTLPDQDLAYLVENTFIFDDYVKALDWAQRFAALNREIMMTNVGAAIQSVLPIPFERTDLAINCHHNYVRREHHFGKNVLVTRKGAVSARAGELGIIPGSMGAKSYIVRGKGNPLSLNSCSHGAGRRMSRNKARDMFTLEDHAKATAGVECRKDIDVIDETPMAYKDIDAVMEAQKDLVEVVHTLKQVLCVKG